MKYEYTPHGVCSRHMTVDIEDGVIKGVKVVGGCSGNLQGISRLITGMKAEDAVAKMKGIRCGFKHTSCPDQLAMAIEEALGK